VIRERLIALRERRAALVARAEHQRETVTELVGRAETVFSWVERACSLGRTLRAHPAWVAAGVALLVALRPRKMFKLFGTGMTLWRGWRSLRAAYERYVPRQPAVRPAA
jgi:hypothetical protein